MKKLFSFVLGLLLFFNNCLKVGRAGRFGTKGMAVSFVSTEDDS